MTTSKKSPIKKASAASRYIKIGFIVSGLVTAIAVLANLTKIYEFYINQTESDKPPIAESKQLPQNDFTVNSINGATIINSNIVQGEGSSAKISNQDSAKFSSDDDPTSSTKSNH